MKYITLISAGLIVLCSAMLSFSKAGDIAPQPSRTSAVTSSPATLDIDFSQAGNGVSPWGIGFNQSLPLDDIDLVSQLRPTLWRGPFQAIVAPLNSPYAPNTYALLKNRLRCGEHIQVVLSEGFSHSLRPRYQDDSQAWVKHCRDIATEVHKRKYRVEYDPWNEPDRPDSWNPDNNSSTITKAETDAFFRIWATTVKCLRETDSRAVITGPSISKFDSRFMSEFLVFCKSNGCLPDVLSWHEKESPDGASIPVNVASARRILKQLGIQRQIRGLSISEMMPRREFLDPAATVSYFANIGKAAKGTPPIESTGRSYWLDLETAHPKGSFNGLLTSQSDKEHRGVRSSFYIYRMLNAFGASRNGRRFCILPGTGPSGLAVVDGYSASVLAGSTGSTTTLTLRFLNSPSKKKHYGEWVAYGSRIPLGWEGNLQDGLETEPLRISQVAGSSNFTIRLPEPLLPGEAYYLTVFRPKRESRTARFFRELPLRLLGWNGGPL